MKVGSLHEHHSSERQLILLQIKIYTILIMLSERTSESIRNQLEVAFESHACYYRIIKYYTSMKY